MKLSTFVFSLTVLLCVAFCDSAVNPQYPVLLRQRRQSDYSDKTKELFQELIKNIRSSVKTALETVKEFMTGLIDQLPPFQSKFSADIELIRHELDQAAETAKGEMYGVVGTIKCFQASSKKADDVINSAVNNTLNCAADRVGNVSELILELTKKAESLAEAADDAPKKMKKCTTNSGGIVSIGSCLASVTLHTELKGVVFFVESGVLSAKIKIAMEKLPAELQLCAGAQLVKTGVAIAGIMVDIGKCATSSIISADDSTEPSSTVVEASLS